jgi:hypothetical protein
VSVLKSCLDDGIEGVSLLVDEVSGIVGLLIQNYDVVVVKNAVTRTVIRDLLAASQTGALLQL